MRGMLLQVAAVLFVTALATAAQTQERPHRADPKTGREFAQTNCDACHIVGVRAEFPPPMSVNAPTFVSIANRPSVTAQSLQAVLSRPHVYRNMPAVDLTESDAANVIAYILSLRSRR